MSTFIKICHVGVAFVHADEWMDRQTWQN